MTQGVASAKVVDRRRPLPLRIVRGFVILGITVTVADAFHAYRQQRPVDPPPDGFYGRVFDRYVRVRGSANLEEAIAWEEVETRSDGRRRVTNRGTYVPLRPQVDVPYPIYVSIQPWQEEWFLEHLGKSDLFLGMLGIVGGANRDLGIPGNARLLYWGHTPRALGTSLIFVAVFLGLLLLLDAARGLDLRQAESVAGYDELPADGFTRAELNWRSYLLLPFFPFVLLGHATWEMGVIPIVIALAFYALLMVVALGSTSGFQLDERGLVFERGFTGARYRVNPREGVRVQIAKSILTPDARRVTATWSNGTRMSMLLRGEAAQLAEAAIAHLDATGEAVAVPTP